MSRSPRLCTAETQRLIAETIAAGNIPSDARRHPREWHRLSEGDPRMLEKLLIECSTRHYRRKSFALDPLALDRSIHELDAAIKAAVEQNT